jgi:hypothetical protein
MGRCRPPTCMGRRRPPACTEHDRAGAGPRTWQARPRLAPRAVATRAGPLPLCTPRGGRRGASEGASPFNLKPCLLHALARARLWARGRPSRVVFGLILRPMVCMCMNKVRCCPFFYGAGRADPPAPHSLRRARAAPVWKTRLCWQPALPHISTARRSPCGGAVHRMVWCPFPMQAPHCLRVAAWRPSMAWRGASKSEIRCLPGARAPFACE